MTISSVNSLDWLDLPVPKRARRNVLSDLLKRGHVYTTLVFEFLSPSDVAAMARISKKWRDRVNANWESQCAALGIRPESSMGMNRSRLCHQLFSRSMGPAFYKKFFGLVTKVPPIPRNIIEVIDCIDPHGNGVETFFDTYRLTLFPDFIWVTLPSKSPLFLDEEGRLENNNAPLGVGRTIRVQFTRHNMEVLINKCSRNPLTTAFPNHNDVFADEPLGAPHWVFQRIIPVLLGQSESDQQRSLISHRLQAPSKNEKAIFKLLRAIQEKKPDHMLKERTSSVDHQGRTVFCWWEMHGAFRLKEGVPIGKDFFNRDQMGMAVKVPVLPQV